jgi:hypothetical protein
MYCTYNGRPTHAHFVSLTRIEISEQEPMVCALWDVFGGKEHV